MTLPTPKDDRLRPEHKAVQCECEETQLKRLAERRKLEDDAAAQRLADARREELELAQRDAEEARARVEAAARQREADEQAQKAVEAAAAGDVQA